MLAILFFVFEIENEKCRTLKLYEVLRLIHSIFDLY